jgi:hypothetical protein
MLTLLIMGHRYMMKGGNEMSVNQEMIAEIAGAGHGATYRRVHERNGHKDPSELLSWYWARPQFNGL